MDVGENSNSIFNLRLYVNGISGKGSYAIANLRTLLERHLPNQFELEIIDIAENPDALDEDNVLATPTLIKILPAPVVRLVGDLSNSDAVLSGMDLPTEHRT